MAEDLRGTKLQRRSPPYVTVMPNLTVFSGVASRLAGPSLCSFRRVSNPLHPRPQRDITGMQVADMVPDEGCTTGG